MSHSNNLTFRSILVLLQLEHNNNGNNNGYSPVSNCDDNRMTISNVTNMNLLGKFVEEIQPDTRNQGMLAQGIVIQSHFENF